jgi:hypothetical protein
VIAQMENGEWKSLAVPPAADNETSVRVPRRWLLRPVDYIREKMPVGDR